MIFWLIRYKKSVYNLLKSSIGCASIDIEFKTLVLCIRNDYQITGTCNPHTESHCFHSQRDDFSRIWSIREYKLVDLILIIVCSQSLEISKSYHGPRTIETMILGRGQIFCQNVYKKLDFPSHLRSAHDMCLMEKC